MMERARRNELVHFDVDLSKLDDTVKWVVGIIKVNPNVLGWGIGCCVIRSNSYRDNRRLTVSIYGL